MDIHIAKTRNGLPARRDPYCNTDNIPQNRYPALHCPPDTQLAAVYSDCWLGNTRSPCGRLRQGLQPLEINQIEQLQRWAVGLLRTPFPFLHCGDAGIEISREHPLTGF